MAIETVVTYFNSFSTVHRTGDIDDGTWNNGANTQAEGSGSCTFTTIQGNINNKFTPYLKCSDLAANIPSDGITGINVEFVHQAWKSPLNTKFDVGFESVFYELPSGNQSNNKITIPSPSDWNVDVQTDSRRTSFGGPNDLWGAGLTQSSANDPNFSLYVAANIISTSVSPNLNTIGIDAIKVTIYYETGTGGGIPGRNRVFLIT